MYTIFLFECKEITLNLLGSISFHFVVDADVLQCFVHSSQVILDTFHLWFDARYFIVITVNMPCYIMASGHCFQLLL